MLLFGSALISASKVAYFSLRPEDIENFKTNKSKKAQAVLKLYNNPEKLLSTILVPNNTINIAVVLLAAYLSSKFFDFSSEPVVGFLVDAVAITFLLLFFGEVMPKVYASRNNIAVALLMAYPITLPRKSSACNLPPISSSSYVKKRTGTRQSNISMNDISDALELTSDELR